MCYGYSFEELKESLSECVKRIADFT
jgi:hypothetical protein